jgi:hypothetical protein
MPDEISMGRYIVRIEAVIPLGLAVQKPERFEAGRQKVDVFDPATRDGEMPQSTLSSINLAEGEDKNTESSKGVLDLIQEGHFKGVADVRLRINFSDELVAIEQSQTKQAVSQKMDGILEAVSSTLKSAELTETSLDAFIDPFEQAIDKSREDFLGAEVQSESILISELESALENLVTSLTQELSSTAAEGPEEGNVLADVGIVEDTPLSGLISALKAAFSTAMDDLSEILSNANILPELSAPNGNGVAYEKFLAIYNEMMTSRDPVDSPSNSDRLDTSA